MINSKQLIHNLFSGTGYVAVSDILTDYLDSFVEAGILSRMIYLSEYYERTGQLRDGAFFWTRESIEQQFKVSHFVQRQIFDKFIKLELISKKQADKSLNKRNYYTINFDKLAIIFSTITNTNQIESQTITL